MTAGSIDKALERIEAALARIEDAGERHDGDAAALRARHEDLKSAVSRSLTQLDRLIARQER